MPRSHPTQPDPDHFWPSCDQEPSGVSIQPLSHADLQALLAHLNRRDQDERLLTRPGRRRPTPGQPVVAVRVRASVGRPGASAHSEYRRRRAIELVGWRRGLPWRVAAVLPAAAAAWLLAVQLAPHLTPLAVVAAVAGLGWAGSCGFAPAPTAEPGGAAPQGSGAPPACSLPWSATAGRSCTTWPSPAPRPTSTTWPSAPAASWSSTPSSTGAGCCSTPTGCSGTAATCLSRPCARSGGRPTRPTRSSASPTSRSRPLWPCMAPASLGARSAPMGSRSFRLGEYPTCLSRCRQS